MGTNQHLMQLAAKAATAAADYIATAPRPASTDWDIKGHSDFATVVDRRAEQIITDIILEHEPDSAIVGEEFTPDKSTSGLTWIVDPLDGTTNFLHGFPVFAVSIAAASGNELIAGAVFDVPTQRLYRCAAGQGAWLETTRLTVSRHTDPALSLIGTGFPFKATHLLERHSVQLRHMLRHTSGVRRAGAAAIDLAYVACGIFEGFWELMLAPWDVAAGTLLVREAGGLVTDTDGSPDVLAHGPIVAGNPALHDWLLTALNEPDR